MQTSNRRIRIPSTSIWIICCLVIAACHPFAPQPLDETYASRIKTIAVSVPAAQGSSLSEPGGGLASIVEGHPYREESDLDVAFDKLNFHLEKEIAAAIKTELSKHGINSVASTYVPDENKTPSDEGTTSSDVILFVDIFAARYARDIGEDDFKPFALIGVRMIDPKTTKIVYKHQFFYDPRNLSDADVVFFPVDSKYYFNSREALLSNPKLAAEGLSAVAAPLAKAIATQIAP